ncbi:MAG: ParM/StbA family protein [Desulfobacterales bacterium]|nr:ParM/StbA family protein [Desulfobacterales bacterium]
MQQVLGIDIGFGFTKATNGRSTIIFKSLSGEAADIQYWADFGESQPVDQIHVSIDGKSYFIGELAEQQSSAPTYTLDQDRLVAEYVRILALTAAGLLIQNGMVNVPVNVVSGLPIGHFRRHHERFRDLLTGHHAVAYHSPNGQSASKSIYINKVRMLPQPLGSILNLLMDDHGRITQREVAAQKIGVVDIGFRTTDFCIMDRLRHIDRGSRTIDSGMSKAFGLIAQKLQEKCGVAVELYRLYQAVEEGTIRMRGKAVNFSAIRDHVFEQLAAGIAGEIDRLWAHDWDIDMILLTGGGSRELARHLRPLIAGNVVPLEPHTDSRLNNVFGYMKYGRFIWGNGTAGPSAEAAPAPQPSERPAVASV